MSEEQYDIDIYGDLEDPGPSGAPDEETNVTTPRIEGKTQDNDEVLNDVEGQSSMAIGKIDIGHDTAMNGNDEALPAEVHKTLLPDNPNKRKYPDNRPVEQGATTALYISDLHWWTTDDDIRGWVRASDCEDELKDITFNEHKVNGKSKGIAFVEFATPQSSSAVKARIESSTNSTGYMSRKPNIIYTSPHHNPFRTLPKDGPQRGKDGRDNDRIDRPDRGPGSSGPSRTGFHGVGAHAPSVGSTNFGVGVGGGGGNAASSGGGYRGGRPIGSRGAPFLSTGRGGQPLSANGMSSQYPSSFAPTNAVFNPQINTGFQGSQLAPTYQTGRGNLSLGRPSHMAHRGRGGMGPSNMVMGGGGPLGPSMSGTMGMGNMGGHLGSSMGHSTGMENYNPMMGFNPMLGGQPGFQPNSFGAGYFGQGPTAGQDQQWNPHGAKRPRQG